MSNYDPAFGRYIRQHRTTKGLTQQEVATRIGASLPYYNKIENAKLPPPGPETLEGIARALDVDRDEVYAVAGKIPSDVIEVLRGRPDLWRMVREYARKHPR